MKLFPNFQTSALIFPFVAARKFSVKTPIEQLKIPTKTLNNGHKMPVIGLGTWGSLGDEVIFAVKTAIYCGYRMIDTAFVYENEKFVGQAIQQLIKEKVIKRNELFVTSKLWNTYHQPDLVCKAVRLSLNDLQLSYLDLYLMHWPTAYLEGKILLPRDDQGKTKFSDIDYVQTWKAMEELQDLGLTKTIGLCNFNKAQIERVWAEARIKPAVLQCECHPFLNQKKLIKFCADKGMAFTAYSPLGSWDTRPYAVKGEARLLEAKEINEIAERNKKTPAQILLRYQIQRGNIVIPKSVIKSQIESNLKVFDWELSSGDMNVLDKMNRNYRYVAKVREAGNHKHYPFLDEY